MIFSSPCSVSGNGVERRYLQQWMNCACSIVSYWCVCIQCLCILTYSVCMDLNDEKVPLAMVWSLLSYSESKLRLWRSWNASTRRHAILLAFNNLVIKMVIQMLQVTDDGSNDKALFSRIVQSSELRVLTAAVEKTIPQRVLWKFQRFCSHIAPCGEQTLH